MQTPKGHTIFLLDAAGAALSIAGLFFVYRFDDFFGMPPAVIVYFICIALALLVFSTTVYISKPPIWRIYLKILACLNVAYCLFTIYQLVMHTATLTIYGYVYLLLETAVILALSAYEWKQSGSSSSRSKRL